MNATQTGRNVPKRDTDQLSFSPPARIAGGRRVRLLWHGPKRVGEFLINDDHHS